MNKPIGPKLKLQCMLKFCFFQQTAFFDLLPSTSFSANWLGSTWIHWVWILAWQQLRNNTIFWI